MEYVGPSYNGNPALKENTLRAHDRIGNTTYCSKARQGLGDPTPGVLHKL